MNSVMDLTQNESTQSIGKAENLVELLRQRGEHQGDRLAYCFRDSMADQLQQLNYRQLDSQARAIAVAISQRVKPGERVVLLYPPGLEFISAFFGCLYAGVVAVPAYPPRRNQHLAKFMAIVDNAQPGLIITSLELWQREAWATKEPLDRLRWLVTDTIDPAGAEQWQPPLIHSADLAFLQYTSGSTGQPKGVMVSHGNLMHNSQLIYRYFGHSPHSQGVIWLPSYHDMGLIGGVIQPLYGGFPVTLMSPLDFLQRPLRWLQAISDHQATTSGAPNFAYELCVHKVSSAQLATLDLSSWQVAFTGAEPVRAETLERFSHKFAACGFNRDAFYPCYGMAETTLIVTGGQRQAWPQIRAVDSGALERHQVQPAILGQHQRQLVSCGHCVGQKVVIVDPQSLEPLVDGQVGEVWILGASVAQGYWRQPALTAQVFCAYQDQEGPFLRTGDLGFISAGELYVTGRLKDMMIIRGQNHYPQDIELTVERSHPALRAWGGAAFAIEWDGQECPIVIHEIERSYLRQLPATEIIDAIRQAVAAEHGLALGAIALLKTGSIPKTSSGKIQRYACRSGFQSGSLQVVADWANDPHIKSGFIQLQHDLEDLDRALHRQVVTVS
jgi:acyl-CoA synthetase (AMP-forming)/AMP-acid ligase II